MRMTGGARKAAIEMSQRTPSCTRAMAAACVLLAPPAASTLDTTASAPFAWDCNDGSRLDQSGDIATEVEPRVFLRAGARRLRERSALCERGEERRAAWRQQARCDLVRGAQDQRILSARSRIDRDRVFHPRRSFSRSTGPGTLIGRRGAKDGARAAPAPARPRQARQRRQAPAAPPLRRRRPVFRRAKLTP